MSGSYCFAKIYSELQLVGDAAQHVGVSWLCQAVEVPLGRALWLGRLHFRSGSGYVLGGFSWWAGRLFCWIGDWWFIIFWDEQLVMIFHPQRLEDENWPRVEKMPGEHDVQLLQQGIQVSAPVTAWFMATVNYTCWLTHLDCWVFWYDSMSDVCVCIYVNIYTQIHITNTSWYDVFV